MLDLFVSSGLSDVGASSKYGPIHLGGAWIASVIIDLVFIREPASVALTSAASIIAYTVLARPQ